MIEGFFIGSALVNSVSGTTAGKTYKGSDIASIDPETNQITPLFNPRQDNWQEHFQLDNAEFRPLTDKARVTVKL